MRNTTGFTLYPSMVPSNTAIRVQCMDARFPAESYEIRNDAEKVVRRGKICVPANEFYVSSGGLDCGEYWIAVGDGREKFVVY